MTIYILTAYRWGKRSDHSYTVGATDSLDKAKQIAEAQADYRGGKYDVVVDAHPLNVATDGLENLEVYRAKGRRL